MTRRFKTLVLNGTETWKKGTFPSTRSIRVYTNLPDAAVGSMVVNDQGYDGYYTGQKLGCIRVVNNAGTPILDVYEDNNVYADVEAWSAHLAESPMTVVYELATPTTESADPYTAIQDAGTTEEFLGTAVPVGVKDCYYCAQSIVDVKADKVQNATNGNFAALDSAGNLVDSGHKHSDYLTAH